MPIPARYQADAQAIIAYRHQNGADYWATPDGRLLKGGPFSTLECVSYLLELGMEQDDPLLRGAAALIWQAQRPDGRFRLSPSGAIYPCHTIHAAHALCLLGQGGDPRLGKTFRHLLDIQMAEGGWRCNKFSFGRGPETQYANPHPTLTALDAFRFSPQGAGAPALEGAVALLLKHWRIRIPIGPCHYGIGSRFMSVEYPFRNYNLFYYVYVLSFYPSARRDERFLEALEALTNTLEQGQIVPRRVPRQMADMAFCRQGQPSALATQRYRQILDNMTQCPRTV